MELRVLDLEREVSEWREPGARELTVPAPGRTAAFRRADGAPGRQRREFPGATGSSRRERDSGRTPGLRTRRSSAAGHARPIPQDERSPAGDRTQVLIDRGRRAARQPRLRPRRGRKIAVASAAGLVLLAIGATVAFRKGPSWPPSVATVQSETTTACQNPDVVSEPGQVNFACGQGTSQVLWVFALLTSGDDPGYAGAGTGRKGLEPITPAQGGQIAWSLNLHHPYDPLHPVDSLEVAARAINDIIGGATVTGADGNPTVQPGLESKPGNCARYTGSPAVVSRAGFPGRCASPVASGEGQAALVADVYQQWMTGATAIAAQDASVLFDNASNPADPQVQAILKTLPDSGR